MALNTDSTLGGGAAQHGATLDSAKLKVTLQTLQNVPANVEASASEAIARINQSQILPTLLGENIFLTAALAAFQHYGYGTLMTGFFDRTSVKMGEKKDATESYDSFGNKLRSIEILTRVDTALEGRFYVDQLDSTYAFPQKMAGLLAQNFTALSNDIFSILSSETLELLTGKVAASSDGRSYSAIKKVTITDPLTINTNEARFEMYLRIAKEVDRMSKMWTTTAAGTNRSDYICVVSYELYRVLSAALERYNSASIQSIVHNKLVGMMVNGLRIIQTPLLHNSFYAAKDATLKAGEKRGQHAIVRVGTKDWKIGQTISEVKGYDFSKIHAIIMHKQALLVRYWGVFDTFLDTRAGHYFYTVRSTWGIKDGLLRPELVTYFST